MLPASRLSRLLLHIKESRLSGLPAIGICTAALQHNESYTFLRSRSSSEWGLPAAASVATTRHSPLLDSISGRACVSSLPRQPVTFCCPARAGRGYASESGGRDRSHNPVQPSTGRHPEENISSPAMRGHSSSVDGPDDNQASSAEYEGSDQDMSHDDEERSQMLSARGSEGHDAHSDNDQARFQQLPGMRNTSNSAARGYASQEDDEYDERLPLDALAELSEQEERKKDQIAATIARDGSLMDSWNASPRLRIFMQDFKRATPKQQKFMLKRMVTGREELFGDFDEEDQVGLLEEQAFLGEFHSQVVEVRGVSKGTRTGGIRRFSAVVVVGNGNGTLGLGAGKAAELPKAVAKANAQALRTLFFVPRYQDSTIWQAQTAKFGKAKVIMYPRSTGSGIMACSLVASICNLAGIKDIGVKIHGTRNSRNIAKALITAFEAQSTPEEVYEQQQLQQVHAPPPAMLAQTQQLERVLLRSTA